MKKTNAIVSSCVAGAIITASCLPAFAYTKDETVYTKLNSDGSEQVTIVSEHLKNEDEDQKLEDLTTLSNILNVNGDEEFHQDGETLTWDSQGNDIYYQGKTDKQLPVSLDITYKFNGQESTVEEMLGKEGTVEICIRYTNHEKQVVDGEELYVPFVVTTGTMLPTDKNRNVKVTNGKVVSNGSNYVVIAIAAPGLKDDFDGLEALDGFDEVTISYQTTDFELKSMMSVATASLLSESDMEIFDKMDQGYSLVDQLMSSYGQLKDGGEKIQSGLNTFSSKYTDFHSGVESLNQGIASAYVGAQSLTSGLTDLNNALNLLDSQSQALNEGAKQTFHALLATANSQLAPQLSQAGISMNALTISNYQTELKTILTKIADVTTVQVTNAVKEQVTAEVTKQADALVQQQVEATIREKVKAGFVQNIVNGYLVSQGIPQMPEEQAKAFLENNETGKALLDQQYEATLQQMKDSGEFDQYVNGAKNDGTYQTTLASQIQAVMNSEDIQVKIKALVEENTNGSDTTAYMQVYNLLVQLETYQKFYEGVQQYTAAVGQIKDGSKSALDGSTQLTQGLAQLKEGGSTLLGASSQIKGATNDLKSGMNTLVAGMAQFDEEGLSKIEDFVKGDIKTNVDKLEKVEKLAQDYQTFDKHADDVEGTTKFIMIMNSKKK